MTTYILLAIAGAILIGIGLSIRPRRAPIISPLAGQPFVDKEFADRWRTGEDEHRERIRQSIRADNLDGVRTARDIPLRDAKQFRIYDH